MGYKHCSKMRRLLGIPEDAYDNLKEDLYKDKTPLTPNQQALVDVVNMYHAAEMRVRRNHVPMVNEIIEVQPMPMPSGLLFYLDWPPKDDDD